MQKYIDFIALQRDYLWIILHNAIRQLRILQLTWRTLKSQRIQSDINRERVTTQKFYN